MPSYLDPRVLRLIEMIFDVEMMKKQMADFGINVKKMPLGKISKTQVLQGYKVLRQIEDVIKSKYGANFGAQFNFSL